MQQESKHLNISTLFLLDHIAAESEQGTRLQWIRTSPAMWFQLLSVLLAAWILIQPRWLLPTSVQSTIVVLDSSLSMGAFKDRLDQNLNNVLTDISSTASKNELLLMESDLSSGTLYSGGSVKELMKVVKEWRPKRSSHDYKPALKLASSLHNKKGLTLFVTDHLADVFEGIHVLAIGVPKQNVGFTGVRLYTTPDNSVAWEALVRNYSDSDQNRDWWLEIGDAKTSKRKLELKANQIQPLSGLFPDGVERCKINLSNDPSR